MTTTIQIKTNLFLWLLTGRSSGFFSPALNSGILYETAVDDAAITTARELLRLSDARTDFYVMGALAAAYLSMPLLRGLPDERSLAFVEDIVLLPPTDVTGAELLPTNGTSWPSLDGKPAGASGFTRVTITRDGSDALVTRDDGYSTRVPYQLTGDTLVIPGIADHGINANFTATSWLAGQPIVVRLAPTRYPYADMARSIADSSQTISLMLDEGTMEAFATATDPVRKVGAAAAAIMRRMARAISADQASVSIVVTDTDGELIDVSSNYHLLISGAALLYDGAQLTYTP